MPSTFHEKLAAYFTTRPLIWIDGRQLATVAGAYAWRTRISELRRPPSTMTIENRLRRVRLDDGHTVVVSEYRWVPPRGQVQLPLTVEDEPMTEKLAQGRGLPDRPRDERAHHEPSR